MRSIRSAAVGAALTGAAIACSSPASAAIVTATFTGVITDGIDSRTALFHTPTRNLDGFGIELEFTFDTSLGTPFAPFSFFQNQNGAGAFSPITSAVITVNGFSHSVLIPSGSSAVSYRDEQIGSMGPHDLVDYAASGSSGDSDNSVDYFLRGSVASFTHEIVSSTDFTQPVDYAVQPGDDAGETAIYSRRIADNDIVYFFQGDVLWNHVRISATAVPEPATWAMMLIGFGVVGAATRGKARAFRKQRRVTAS